MTDYYALGKMDAHGVAPLKEAAARCFAGGYGYGYGFLWFPEYVGRVYSGRKSGRRTD